MREANLELLNKSINYIFSTLKTNNERALEIKKELAEIEERKSFLEKNWSRYHWIGLLCG